MDSIRELLADPAFIKLLKLLLWIGVTVAVVTFFRRSARKRIENTVFRYKTQKLIEILGYFMIILLVILFVTVDNVRDYTIIIGLFTAGLTFTLQELILSVAGSFYIFAVRVYKPGDRIEINGITGDVIDIDSIYTTLMEIGAWVSTDNYSGRIVKISNAYVFKGPIHNYSLDFPFVWDELNVLITYQSDLEEAKRLVLQEANTLLAAYTTASTSKWKELVERYYIEDAALEPNVAVKLTDNWIQLNLRYITDYKKRRKMQQDLFERIESVFKSKGESVIFASSTLQLLKIPEVDVRMQSS
ncbi:mechanosensitive ion channel [Zeaxanthinibacter sp. PT1]|uniref:mechanosensitive ion channel family protein n=1 Tax=Zeaxanthinibacter TaxID=561554 RepID=UPI002349058B|nr:mechanosensitive ion channel domain-containing protein [Zeaxanthinibacter sp. PT1]MDC6351935.1 mechanosensitive ion channel [Zeaxanthinibacter sp. PT1]